MQSKLFATKNDVSIMVLRIILGLVIFPHGAQKLLGWFGGYGFTGTMNFFTQSMGIPYLFALLAIFAEFFGSIGLVVGLGTRIAALGIGVNMVAAALMVHVQNGFFINWAGNQAGEGFEFQLLVIGMALALIISGGGKWSLDRLLYKTQEDNNSLQ